MALDKPYCTLEDVQKETKNSSSSDTSWYQNQINLASRYIEDYCNTDFRYQDYSSTAYTVPRAHVLEDEVHFPWPILTITGVWVYSDHTESPADADKYEDDTYYFRAGEFVLYKQGAVSFPQPGAIFGTYPFIQNMDIKGTFGYALDGSNPDTAPPPTMPAAVRRACTLIAANWSNENRKEEVGLDGARTELLETSVPDEAKMLLHPWRQHSTFF